jgi:glycerol-1-phosphate dehydrogenase [NAD(P)+]
LVDLVSNLSALEDWKLGSKRNGEYINNFAYSLSLLSANSILNYSREDLYTDPFLQSLAYGLILSGLSMVIAGSSRPCSGAEHQISHVIDELYPDRATLHGIQVAWGHLLLEHKYRKKNLKTILDFFTSVGLIDEIEKLIHYNDEEVQLFLKSCNPQG